ncbi:transposase-like protein [Rhizobium sp. 1399]|nr:transposase-like protein [Rhizobium sp. 1399]
MAYELIDVSYKSHRFPPQIIAHAVWLFRFPLSLRLVEEMLLERGIVVSYETTRRWGRKFGAAYLKQLRRKKSSRKDIWHLDEVVISIGGRNTGFGEPSIGTATFSTKSYRLAATRGLPSDYWSGC